VADEYILKKEKEKTVNWLFAERNGLPAFFVNISLTIKTHRYGEIQLETETVTGLKHSWQPLLYPYA